MVETLDYGTLLYNWLKECEKNHIILSFKGDFNQDLVNAILVLAERGPEVQNSSTLVRSRVFSILVECMQNIRKYGAVTPQNRDLKPGIVIICIKNGSYLIKTGNFVYNNEVPALQEKLDKIKAYSKEELKAIHKKVLSETQLSEKSGAGLGLISIARKGDAFNYQFKKIDDGLTFYSLDIDVSNGPK